MNYYKSRPKISTSVLYVALVLGSLLMLIPFLYMLSTALKGQIYIFEMPPRFIPQNPTLENFITAWQSNNFSRYFGNSLLVAVSTTALSVVVSSMFAYAFARFQFWGKSVLFYAVLLTLMLPNLMLIIPEFILVKNLGLRNNLLGLIIVYLAFSIPLNTFLLRGFFEGLPRELEEAVLIDGGNYWTIFTRIVMPLSTPALATVSIFTFLFAWDEFTWALTAIDDPALRTLPIALATFQGQYATQWGLVFAASLISIAPVLVVFVTLQRYFIKGLTQGAVRG